MYATDGSATSSGVTATWTNIQLELGSTATSYEPYFDGGTAQAPAPLFAVGNAADEYEAVSGTTTRKMARIDLGTLEWPNYNSVNQTHPYGYVIPRNLPELVNRANLLVDGYSTKDDYMTDKTVNYWSYSIIDSSFLGKSGSEIKQSLSGVYLYCELATPTTSQSTPTQISLQAGNNVAMQTDGGRLAPIDITYESDEL